MAARLAAAPPPPLMAGAQPPVWFPWAGAALGLLLGTVGLVWFVRVLPRSRRALTTTGTLVDVGKDRSLPDHTMWRLTVAYVDGGGAPRRGTWVGRSSLDWTVYRPGMQVPVRYDPVTATVVDLPGGRRPHALLVPGVLAVFGPCFAAAWWLMTS